MIINSNSVLHAPQVVQKVLPIRSVAVVGGEAVDAGVDGPDEEGGDGGSDVAAVADGGDIG